MKSQRDTDLLANGGAFAYPGYLQIALCKLVRAEGLAGLDDFGARAKATISVGDDDAVSLATVPVV
jgi:hypothetical protein